MLFFYSGVPSLMFNCDFAINSLKFVVVSAATDFNARPWTTKSIGCSNPRTDSDTAYG